MERRTKLICVAPGLGVAEFIKCNDSRLSVTLSSSNIDDVKSLIGEYDLVIVPYEEAIMKEMKTMYMNFLVVIPKMYRYSEVLDEFARDTDSIQAGTEEWEHNVFIPINNGMNFMALDTGEFLTNSLDKIMVSPLGYNYPSNWLISKKFVLDRTDVERYKQNSNFKKLLLEITKYGGNVVCISLEGDGISLSNKVSIAGITTTEYYKEIDVFKQMSDNTIEINSRTLGCPRGENGLINWVLVRQQLVSQHLLPQYKQ